MKFKFILFGFNYYDSRGGFNDSIFTFNDFEDFQNKLKVINNKDIYYDFFEILDITTLENFRILDIKNLKNEYLKKNDDSSVNVKSKLKRAVKGYFQYDNNR